MAKRKSKKIIPITAQEEEAALALNNEGRMWSWKWDETQVLDLLEKMHNFLLDNQHVYLLGELLISFELHVQWWRNMANKFKEHEEIDWKFKYIKSVLETRVVKGALNGSIKEKTAGFVLVNHYGWKINNSVPEAPQLPAQQTTNIQNNFTVTKDLSTDDLLELERIMLKASNKKS